MLVRLGGTWRTCPVGSGTDATAASTAAGEGSAAGLATGLATGLGAWLGGGASGALATVSRGAGIGGGPPRLGLDARRHDRAGAALAHRIGEVAALVRHDLDAHPGGADDVVAEQL